MESSISNNQQYNFESCSSILPIVATSGLIIPREKARQNIAKQFDLLSLESEEAFSRLVMVASRAVRTSITALAFMGEKEHYFRAKIGFDGSTIAREWSICTLTYLHEHSKAFVIPNTLKHPLTKDHLIVNNPPYIRSYAAASIFLDGVKVGTICTCDYTPHAFSDREVDLLIDMAACVSDMLTLRSRRWIQEHVNGISISSEILSSIKTPLEDVGKDVDQFLDLVEEIESCSSATTVSSTSFSRNNSLFDMQSVSSATDTHHPINSLTPCSSFTMSQSGRLSAPLAFSQDSSSFSTPSPTSSTTGAPEQSVSTPFHTSHKHMPHSQKSNQSTHHSSSKSNNEESLNCNNTESALEQLQIIADNLREDVKYLGQAIDLSIQRMLEISLRSSSTSSSLASSLETPFSTLSFPSPDNRTRYLRRSFSTHNLYENEDEHNTNDHYADNHVCNDDDDSSHNDACSLQQQFMVVEEIYNTLASQSTSPVSSPTASSSHHTHKAPLIMTNSVKLPSHSRNDNNKNNVSTNDTYSNEEQTFSGHYHHHKRSHSRPYHHPHHHADHCHHSHRENFTVPTIITSFTHHHHPYDNDLNDSHNKMGVAELSYSTPNNSNMNGNNNDNSTNNNVNTSNHPTLSQNRNRFRTLNQLSNPTNNGVHGNNSSNMCSLRRTNSGSSLLRYLSPRFNYNNRYIPRPEDDAHQHHHYHHRHVRHNTDLNDNENPSSTSNINDNANHES